MALDFAKQGDLKEEIKRQLEETEREIEELKTFTWYNRDVNKLKKEWYKLHEKKRTLKKLLEFETDEKARQTLEHIHIPHFIEKEEESLSEKEICGSCGLSKTDCHDWDDTTTKFFKEDVKEFIKWCEAHSHISEGVQVISIDTLKQKAGDKLIEVAKGYTKEDWRKDQLDASERGN